MASSTNPEGMAILSALEVAPPNRTVRICSDSQSALQRLCLITSGEYDNIPILHVLKIPNWQTWEAIHNIITTKNLTVLFLKIEVHSGNTFNDIADETAKEACELQNPVFIYNNSDGSRISFALTNRNAIVEKNTRRFLRHMTQNIHRANWSIHHTSARTSQVAKVHDIDWQMYREVFNTDGNQKSGFSSSKTSNLRSYILKAYTNTSQPLEFSIKNGIYTSTTYAPVALLVQKPMTTSGPAATLLGLSRTSLMSLGINTTYPPH